MNFTTTTFDQAHLETPISPREKRRTEAHRRIREICAWAVYSQIGGIARATCTARRRRPFRAGSSSYPL